MVFDTPKAEVLRRTVKGRKARADNSDIAANVIGPLSSGDELLILTAGNFSLIDILLHILDFTGPAHVDCATWTQGVYDQERAGRLVSDGRIKSMRWVVDPSMFQRRPELSGRLVERFGEDSFRAVSIHAKYLVVRGETMQVAVRSSMNMNENQKIEQVEISVCDEVSGFLTRYTDSVFDAVSQSSRSNTRKVFSQVLAKFQAADKAATGELSFKDRWGIA